MLRYQKTKTVDQIVFKIFGLYISFNFWIVQKIKFLLIFSVCGIAHSKPNFKCFTVKSLVKDQSISIMTTGVLKFKMLFS